MPPPPNWASSIGCRSSKSDGRICSVADNLALDVVDEVGPDGHFLDSDHTLKHYEKNWLSTLLDRQNHDNRADRENVVPAYSTTAVKLYQSCKKVAGRHNSHTIGESVDPILLNDLIGKWNF